MVISHISWGVPIRSKVNNALATSIANVYRLRYTLNIPRNVRLFAGLVVLKKALQILLNIYTNNYDYCHYIQEDQEDVFRF